MDMIVFWIMISTVHHLSFCVPLYPYRTDVSLNDYNRISVNWRHDDLQKRVYFSLECTLESDVNWLAFGFSNHGEYEGADLCVWNGLALVDSYVDNQGAIRSDTYQHCHLDHVDRYPDGRITLYFWRAYDTCGKDDYVIEDGTTQLVVMIGKTRRKNVFGDHVSKTIKPTRLLQTITTMSELGEDVQLVDITSNNVTIPAKETTYWCTVMRLPPMNNKRHIIKYEAIIQKGNEHHVHHMEVYHCEMVIGTRFPLYSGDCHSTNVPPLIKACRRVIGAWAMGAPPMVYPPEAGAPIGGPGYFPVVMIEIHYNNPMRSMGVLDNSGIRFHVTSQLRPFDAGVIEVGLEYTDRMAIPPRQHSFPLTGYCTPECTDALLSNRGITIFASQLHSHLLGRQLATWHVREGVQLGTVNRDKHYSPHWQEIRPIKPVKVFPGDSLITTCVYDTSRRVNVTLGGFGIEEEMCVNYLHYYPKGQLEVCKSAIDASSLKSFFAFMDENEGQSTGSGSSVAEKYKQIQWNSRRVAELKALYAMAPVAAECRRNDGKREQLPSREPIRVTYPLPEEPRRCDKEVDYQ